MRLNNYGVDIVQGIIPPSKEIKAKQIPQTPQFYKELLHSSFKNGQVLENADLKRKTSFPELLDNEHYMPSKTHHGFRSTHNKQKNQPAEQNKNKRYYSKDMLYYLSEPKIRRKKFNVFQSALDYERIQDIYDQEKKIQNTIKEDTTIFRKHLSQRFIQNQKQFTDKYQKMSEVDFFIRKNKQDLITKENQKKKGAQPKVTKGALRHLRVFENDLEFQETQKIHISDNNNSNIEAADRYYLNLSNEDIELFEKTNFQVERKKNLLYSFMNKSSINLTDKKVILGQLLYQFDPFREENLDNQELCSQMTQLIQNMILDFFPPQASYFSTPRSYVANEKFREQDKKVPLKCKALRLTSKNYFKFKQEEFEKQQKQYKKNDLKKNNFMSLMKLTNSGFQKENSNKNNDNNISPKNMLPGGKKPTLMQLLKNRNNKRRNSNTNYKHDDAQFL